MSAHRSPSPLRAGTPEYRETSRVLFLSGFLTFAMLYVAQGILPAVSHDFGISPARASLTLSLTTMPIALAVVLAASWSEGHGRRRLIVGALLGGAVLTLVGAASPGFAALLGTRVLTGLALAALPAVAMAYLAEEVDQVSLGRAMGLYVSGTGLGGMAGRIAGGLLGGALSWRWALAVVGAASIAGGVWVARRLPPSHNFSAEHTGLLVGLGALRHPLRDPVLLGLSACAFALMGSLVSFYNYLQYRLADAPFSLSPTVVAFVFVLYVAGTVSSNWMGRLTERRSRRSVLLVGVALMGAGVLLSLPDLLTLVLAGTALTTFGFFGAHAVASGWVNARATRRRAQASAMYLVCYYSGASVVGFVGGLFYGPFGWVGEAGLVLVLLAMAAAVAVALPATAGPVTAPDPG